MTVFYDIQAALDSRLHTLSGTTPVAWENTNYKPVVGIAYIRPTFLPGNTVGATTATDKNIGVYQIDVFIKANEGKNEAVRLADRIAQHFKPVTELTYNDRIVRCVTVSRERALIDDGWYQIPVTITYLSFTTKRG
jgi:hypothetical protein